MRAFSWPVIRIWSRCFYWSPCQFAISDYHRPSLFRPSRMSCLFTFWLCPVRSLIHAPLVFGVFAGLVLLLRLCSFFLFSLVLVLCCCVVWRCGWLSSLSLSSRVCVCGIVCWFSCVGWFLCLLCSRAPCAVLFSPSFLASHPASFCLVCVFVLPWLVGVHSEFFRRSKLIGWSIASFTSVVLSSLALCCFVLLLRLALVSWTVAFVSLSCPSAFFMMVPSLL